MAGVPKLRPTGGQSPNVHRWRVKVGRGCLWSPFNPTLHGDSDVKGDSVIDLDVRGL